MVSQASKPSLTIAGGLSIIDLDNKSYHINGVDKITELPVAQSSRGLNTDILFYAVRMLNPCKIQLTHGCLPVSVSGGSHRRSTFIDCATNSIHYTHDLTQDPRLCEHGEVAQPSHFLVKAVGTFLKWLPTPAPWPDPGLCKYCVVFPTWRRSYRSLVGAVGTRAVSSH